MEATIAPSSLLNVNDLVEEILLLLPVKSLTRFKCLSKQWRSTIESHSFKARHLKISKKSHMHQPNLISVSQVHPIHPNEPRPDRDLCFETIRLESASVLSSTLLNFPIRSSDLIIVSESFDGLLCIHSQEAQTIHVVNPATRWFRELPRARVQILMENFIGDFNRPRIWVPFLAFVKAADYKLVWLYNSSEYNSDASSPDDGLTKCEVFDFRANAWRYLTCTPSFNILDNQRPAFVNGSLYWLAGPYTAEMKVVALDIHTETFRLLPKLHLDIIASIYPHEIYMWNLDNRLCIVVSEATILKKEIWSLRSLGDTWEKIYTIDLQSCSFAPGEMRIFLSWIPVLICNKNKIFIESYDHLMKTNKLFTYDPETKSRGAFFQHPRTRYLPYFQSLISHI